MHLNVSRVEDNTNHGHRNLDHTKFVDFVFLDVFVFLVIVSELETYSTVVYIVVDNFFVFVHDLDIYQLDVAVFDFVDVDFLDEVLVVFEDEDSFFVEVLVVFEGFFFIEVVDLDDFSVTGF